MKLNLPEITVERSAAFKSQHFEIGNTRVIMEILRGKMYSNPIQTICQEIMSNARDAHREVGKENQPIEVKLPSKLEPSFWIRDFGPGITPDRMANVFIQYGNSTKRNDNTQTGGFGLGAKSPFAYSDTFTVVSVTPENGVFIKRQYLAHIDETGIGQMSCVLEGETQEPQGTTIIITPKQQDFNSFKTYTRQTGAHWKVLPAVLGDPEWEWPSVKATIKGANWAIADDANLHPGPMALIDGIPYRLNLNHIYSAGLPPELRQIPTVPLRLMFNVGEVPVTANREDLDYQQNVITHLKNRIETAVTELKAHLTADLKNKTNLYDAIVLLEELRRKPYGSFLSSAKWRDLDLNKYERIDSSREKFLVSLFRKDVQVKAGCKKLSEGRYRGTRNPPIQIKADTLLIEDDTKKRQISYARLATLFDQNPNVRYVAVVNFGLAEKLFTDPTTKETKSTIVAASEKETIDRKKEADQEFKWSLFNPIKLSAIPKKRMPVGQAATPAKKKAIQKIKKFNTGNSSWDPAISTDYEKLNTCYYVVTSGSTIYLDYASDKRISLHDLLEMTRRLEKLKVFVPVVFGCVPTHVSELPKNWTPLLTYLGEVYHKIKDTNNLDVESPYAAQNVISIAKLLMTPEFLDKLQNGSLLKTYLEASKRITDNRLLLDNLNILGYTLGIAPIGRKQNDQLKDQYDAVLEKYSLLANLQSYRMNSKALDDLALYVIMKDKDQ